MLLSVRFSHLLSAVTTCALLASNVQAGKDGVTLTFPSEDGLAVTADLYAPDGLAGRPVVVLFHQAGNSRGEYCDIAPRLNALGFACIAVDQRSGNQVNGIINETAQLARSQGLGTRFEDALPDMRAALAYARGENGGAAVVAMGSSYSSALILTIAADQPALVDGTLSFSPGEYFVDRKLIETAAVDVNVPAFITSARSERNSWTAIFEAIASEDKVSFLPTSAGRHGASTLWPTTVDNEPTWEAVQTFLSQWLQSSAPHAAVDHDPTTGEVITTFTGSGQVVEASSDLTNWITVASTGDDASSLHIRIPSDPPGIFMRARPVASPGSADVTSVRASGSAGNYTFNVTIASPDTGCEQYADWWEVLSAEGELLYRRVLLHSHVSENPFTRSGGAVAIDADTTVWVRAHMNHSGYGGVVMKGSVTAGFDQAELPATFAAWVTIEEPLPDGCNF